MGTDVTNPVSPLQASNTNIDSAGSLVDSRFSSIESLASSTMNTALGHLQSLADAAAGLTVPTVSTSTTYSPAATEWTETKASAGVPDAIALSEGLPDTPVNLVLGTFLAPIDFSGITVPDIPAYTASPVWADLLTKIGADIKNGGTGLDASVETAIWDRAMARQEADAAEKYARIANDLGSAGFELPPGALAGALVQLTSQTTINATDQSNAIAIEQAQLAQKNTQFAIETGLQIEKQNETLYQLTVQLTLDVAKAKVVLATAMSENVRANDARVIETYKATLSGWVADVDRTYKQLATELDKYKADLQRFSAKKEVMARYYSTKMNEIQNATSFETAIVGLLYQDAANQRSNYSELQKVKIEASKGQAQISSALVSSALNAINASASVSYSGQESMSESWSHSEAIGESHTYNTATS